MGQGQGINVRLRGQALRPGGSRHAHGRDDRFFAVQLRRRSDQQPGRTGHQPGRPRGPARAARPQRPLLRSVRPLRAQRGAWKFRDLVSAAPAGFRSDRRAPARDPRVQHDRRHPRARGRRAHGRLYRPAAGRGPVADISRDLADRHIHTDRSDRHSADPAVRRGSAVAADLRPRRCGRSRLVDHRPADRLRRQGADHAVDHAGVVPDDADHAPGTLGDARGAAHRLHQVRARAGWPTAPSTSVTRSRTPWCR